MKNKYGLYVIKVVLALLIASFILNIVCSFYYNLAVHSKSETRSTDYVWEKNKFYSRGTEGFAWGKTDENGFNNLETFEPGDIDVLVMGSSHIEAFNVAQRKNVVYRLNEKFKAADMDMNSYNIGVSGHTLVRCLNNIGNAVDEFSPSKYVVIEASTLKTDVKDMKESLNGSLKPIESNNGGIVGFLQKIPLLRRSYAQLKSLLGEDDEEPEDGNRKELFDQMLDRACEKLQAEGLQLIIVYNGSLQIGEQGEILEEEDFDLVEDFQTVCEENKVVFVDMYKPFCDYYYETYRLPHGFSNSKAGYGHLNEYGHQIIADELFDVISKLEKE